MRAHAATVIAAAALITLPSTARAQWRAEAAVAARAARTAPAPTTLDAPGATAPFAGTAIAGAAAWSPGARGPWQLELVGTAGHEGLATRSGGDARAVARLGWSRGGRAGLLLDAGGVVAWRLHPAGTPLPSGGESTLQLRAGPARRDAMPARVRGATSSVGGWARLGRVLLSANARTTTAGALRESHLREHSTIIDSIDVRSRFDSLAQRWTFDTLHLGQMERKSWTEEERRRPVVLTDLSVDASTTVGAFAFSFAGGLRHAPPTADGEGWAAARAAFTVREGLGITLQAARLATDPLRALPARRELQLGVLLRPWGTRSLPVALPAAAAPSVRRFAARADRDGQVTLTVDAPDARSVEMMADFTSWRIVPLTRDAAGRWQTTLPVSRGVHRINVRIDGGAWLPPPGIGTGDDGFGGTVGVLVL